jgi:RNA polymerase sigma factor (sigma-70 family)
VSKFAALPRGNTMPIASELFRPLWRPRAQSSDDGMPASTPTPMAREGITTYSSRAIQQPYHSETPSRLWPGDVPPLAADPPDQTQEEAAEAPPSDAAGPFLDPLGSTPATAVLSAAEAQARAARFNEVVLPYLDDAYNLARWLTRNPQDAEDVVQEAFLRGLRFFNAAESTNPRAWILTIVRNTFYSSLKTRRACDTRELSISYSDDPGSDAEIELWDPDQDTPETALVRKTEGDMMRSLIEALPPTFRETLILREMEEFSYQQIAEMTKVPIGTVMSRLSRARALLQAAWRKYQEKERVA